MYKLHTQCRACGYGRPGAQGIKSGAQTEKLVEVFDLGVQPLANDFCKTGQEQSGYAPLKVLFCPRCSLGQLSVVVRPDILYRHYPYVTSTTEMMKAHFRALHKDIKAELAGNSLLEIGSNDGALLETFKGWGYGVIGIDPAENLNALAHKRGVQSLCDLFSSESAKLISSFTQPDVILARHVFCHVDDWQDFVRGLEILCKRNTLICLEVPYCGDTLANVEWDTIYHEHLSYLTIKSVDALLENTKLQLCRVKKYPIHGGAIMLFIRRRDSDVERDSELDRTAEKENITAQTWRDFQCRATELQCDLFNKIHQLSDEKHTIAGLGASAKSTVWVNACKFTRNEIRFIADNTPHKWWTTSPGNDIPITDEGAILRELPDYVLMFCWNFCQEVLERNKLYLSKGGQFIVPVPRVEIIKQTQETPLLSVH